MPDPPHPTESTPEAPASIGRYEVIRLLGEGSMGRVLLAHDPVLDRDVAVKLLRGDLGIPSAARRELVKRMQHEARAAARVAHPNLVVLHDMGEDPAVGLYLVFENVDGPTLKQRLVDAGRLSPAEGARLARELGAALRMAHEAGVLHRDVKPENVMLPKTGGKITDFGIARIPDSTLTHQGGLMGTPAYSAPETFRGGKHSPASDQFSLAATLYEAISGERAFPGDDAVSVAARIASDPPAPFDASLGLPGPAFIVLARALARRPEDRFADCEAFGEALARSLATPVAPEIAPASAGRAASSLPPERRTVQVILGAALVVGTAALVVRTALRAGESSAAPPPPVTAEPAPPPIASHAARARPTALAPRTPRPGGPAHPESTAPAPSASSASSAGSPVAPASASAVAEIADGGSPPRRGASGLPSASAAP